VQALPSLQEAPSGLAGLLQAPVAGLQVPAVWHWSEAVHTTGSVPTQAPATQVSVCVQASPSLQAMPSTGKPARQIPVRPSQVSVPLHGLPSSQSGSALQQPGMPTAHVAASTGDRAVTARAVRAMARRTPNTTRDYRRHLGRPHEISPCASAARALPCGAVAERRRSELGTPTLRVSLTSLLLAALVATAGLPAPAQADAPWLASASPRARKVRLRVGERQRFAAPAVGGDARCSWRLDGQTIPGMALTWDFVPTAAHMGTHRVTLRLDGPAGAAERWWAVRVEPPRPPRVEVASPASTTLEVAQDEGVDLVLRTRPAASGETVQTSWTVDGVPAGEGETLRLAPSHLGRVRARALALGSLGSATAREWEIDVRPTVLAAASPTTVQTPPTPTTLPPPPPPPTTLPPPPPTTLPPPPSTTLPPPPPPPAPLPPPTTVPARPTTTLPVRSPTTLPRPTTTLPARPSPPRPTPTTTPLPPRATPTTAPIVARVAPPTTAPREVLVAPPRTLPPRVASVPPSPAPPTPGAEISTSDIEVLLQRYAKAWRGHDVEELRRIGQVTSEVQAAALRDYFARVEDLDVEVQLLSVRPRGDHRMVRFTRRDRFRDPLGRLVTQETAVEKDVARTANGLRFVLSGP